VLDEILDKPVTAWSVWDALGHYRAEDLSIRQGLGS
jgi:hypothetical protein